MRRILAGAANHLKPHGLLAVEVGHNQDIVSAAFPALPLTWLDTPSGNGMIFLLHKEDLVTA